MDNEYDPLFEMLLDSVKFLDTLKIEQYIVESKVVASPMLFQYYDDYVLLQISQGAVCPVICPCRSLHVNMGYKRVVFLRVNVHGQLAVAVRKIRLGIEF